MISEVKESEYRRDEDTEIIDISNLSAFSRDITLVKKLAEKNRRRGVDILFVDGSTPVTSKYCEEHGIPVYGMSKEVNLSDVNSDSKVVYAVQGQEDRQKLSQLRQRIRGLNKHL